MRYTEITTIEQAFEATGKPATVDLAGIPISLQPAFKAFYEILVITEALNEGWKPDTDKNNTMDEKYIICLEIYHGEVQYHGFHVAKSIGDYSHARVLAYRSQPIVEHMAKYFMPYLQRFMTV